MQLTGQFLIATPSMPDTRFAHSVVLLCAHSDQGAMGIIINKPLPDLRLPTLLTHLDIARSDGATGLGGDIPDMPVHFGGPVETSRGFVLHSPDFFSAEGSLAVADGLVLSTSVEILSEMARGQGPGAALVALGYSGWGPEQLEREIQAGGWLLAEASAPMLFATEDGRKWAAALAQIGVDPRMLSGATGHA
ncbi:MAG: YqgE/AlgH family protein [Roseinatronobacter sp.]|jgi:putative transcriptional regulator|nr:YqgE/AlgH family protein [Roseinatronobacter sp.]